MEIIEYTNEGFCKCYKCGKQFEGQRQIEHARLDWRSSCCKAKGKDWQVKVLIEDVGGED